MGRRGVHHSSALVHGDVIGENAKNFPVQERMCKTRMLQLSSREARDFFCFSQSNFCGEFSCEFSGYNENLTA